MTGGHPSRTDRLRLVADGLRERFRLPARRTLDVLTTAAAVLVGGAIGLAAGSLADEQTYPSTPAAAPLATQILGPQAQLDRLQRDRFHLDITGHLAESTALDQQVHEIHDRCASTGWKVTALRALPRPRPVGLLGAVRRPAGLRLGLRRSQPSHRGPGRSGTPRPPTCPWPSAASWPDCSPGWLVGAAMAHRLASADHRISAAVVALAG